MRPILAALAFAAAALARPGLAAVPKVVTDFAPIQSLTMQVMGDLGTPVMLNRVGGDPHDFQLRPSQAAALARAHVIFWDGPELTPGLASALKTLGTNAKSVALLHDGGGHIRQFAGGEGIDPHAWLDPTNAEAWLGTIATTLAKLDPEHAAAYTANASAAQAKLHALDAKLKAELTPDRGVPIVEFHDAFGYFADHYGLKVVGTIELGDAAAPSAARLARIREVIRNGKAVCIFPEAGRDPRYITAVTEGTGVKIGAGQDFAGTAPGDAPSPGLYARLLSKLAKTVADCVKR